MTQDAAGVRSDRQTAPANTSTSPFDTLATTYDDDFTTSAIGRRMRRAVWRRLDSHARAGDRVLELNCGTGEDAVHLAARGVTVLATDVSPAMLEVARDKARQRGLTARVTVRQLAIEDLGPALDHEPPFDGVLSNFGGLNCVLDLDAVAQGLAQVVRPGGWAVLCVMGPWVPWEWVWYLGHGQVRTALRRLRPAGVVWRGLTIRYPTIGTLRRALGASFQLHRVSAIGALLPPSYVEAWARRHPHWLAFFDRVERRTETWPPLPWLADHYLAEFERRNLDFHTQRREEANAVHE